MEIFKSWQGCAGFYFGTFYFQHPNSNSGGGGGGGGNALIHCILSNCLLGWRRRGTFFFGLWQASRPESILLHQQHTQRLSPCTPTLSCKNSFSSTAGKHRVLSPRITVCICSTGNKSASPPPPCTGDEIVQTQRYFYFPSPCPLAASASRHPVCACVCVRAFFIHEDQVVKRGAAFSALHRDVAAICLSSAA